MTKSDYYHNRLVRHREALDHHLMAIKQGVHVTYHTEQAEFHRKKIEELQAKKRKMETAKDIGPLSGVPQSAPASGLI
jgi:hypothetical protein